MSDDEYVPSVHSDAADETQASPGPSKARWRPLPRATYRSVEYPGPMSRPDQILKVIKQDDIDECFNAPLSETHALEMRYRPEMRSAIPVRGQRVASQKVLVKVVKRRKAQPESDGGVFTADIVGSIPQTVRFRSMADYQYTPSQDGRVAAITQALVELDYDAILDYQVPPLNEDYTEPNPPGPDGSAPPVPMRSTMELQPTPIASARALPYVFNFKMGQNTAEEMVWDEIAQENRTRYVNRNRATGLSVMAIGHGHPVPHEPEQVIRDRMAKLDQGLLERIRKLFEARPVWLRYALFAHLSEKDRYEIENNKCYLPCVAFTYGQGPFWKTLVRFGYDPCADRAAHIYQRMYMYLDVKRSRNSFLMTMGEVDDDKREPFWWEHETDRRVAQGLRPPVDPSKVHIFDGKILHQNKSDFQLCDVTDPVIRRFIDDPNCLADVCYPHSGWYRPLAFECIRSLLRVRFQQVRETHEPATDDAVAEIVEAYNQVGEADLDDKEAADAFMRRFATIKKGIN